jgi:hypothetical protein
MKKIKSILNGALVLSLLGGLIYAIFWLANYSRELKKRVIKIEQICIVTQVEFYQIGSISVAQLDPEWKVKTSCGYTYTLRRKVEPGDTIRVQIIKYRD